MTRTDCAELTDQSTASHGSNTSNDDADRSRICSHALCPVCGDEGIPHRAKLICRRCGSIIQTCCD